MAVEAAVSVNIHGNPFEKVWEKRLPEIDTKHRSRPGKCVDKIDTEVTAKPCEGSDYRSDYCVIAAATKDPGTQRHRPPILVSDRIVNSNLRTSSRSYRDFVQRHTQEGVYEGPVIRSQPRGDEGLRISESRHKQSEEDTELFCCGRRVDWLIDLATCMCGAKAALYHCTKDSNEGATDLEQPCACGRLTKGCASRWGCLALCSIFCPCMCCYLPLKGCAFVAEGYKKQRALEQRRRRQTQT